MIIYAVQSDVIRGRDLVDGTSLYLTKELALNKLNEIKSNYDGSDKVLTNTDTEYEIERAYNYGWFRKGTVTVKWSIKEIEVKEK